MSDLTINFAGIKSPNPFWLASGPPANTAYQVIKAFDKGWGGAVWKTLGIPITNVSGRYSSLQHQGRKIIGLSNIELISDRKFADNLKDIELVKKRFPNNPVIASLMVQTKDEWYQIITDCQNSGVDGLELNFGCPHGMCERGMGSSIGQEPPLVELITNWAKEIAKVPVIVKLTPNITDITEPALAAKRGGADAISLINTLKSITGVDIDNFVSYPVVDLKSTIGGLSGIAIKPIALNMIKNCASDKRIGLPISGIGGIETWRDALEFILLGAGSVQICTAVMKNGFDIINNLVSGLNKYLDEKGFANIEEIRGKALSNTTNWEDLNLNYKIVASINKDKCTGCKKCFISCDEGAYQAISLPEDKKNTIPIIKIEKCTGCNLCSLVCPVENCITMARQDSNNEPETWKQMVLKGKTPKSLYD